MPPPRRRYSPPLPLGSFQHLMRPMTDIFELGGAGSRRRFGAPQDSRISPSTLKEQGGYPPKKGLPADTQLPSVFGRLPAPIGV